MKGQSEVQNAPIEVEATPLRSRIFKAIEATPLGHQEIQYATHLKEAHPELANLLAKYEIDSLHGATSLSLEGVFEHGLVEARTLREMGAVAFGLEHHSQPYERQGVHIVPWTRAGETIRYAEHRVVPFSTHQYVTPHNAHEIAQMPLEAYEKLPPGGMRDHLVGIVREARSLVQHDNLLQREFYPVVYGINSNKIPASLDVKQDSMLRFDIAVEGRVPSEAITGIFVPKATTESLQDTLQRFGKDLPILPLELLRTLDEAEYGWMLRK